MNGTPTMTTPVWLGNTYNINGFLTSLSFTFGMYIVWFKSPIEMTHYKHALSAIVFYTSLFDITINVIARPVALFPLWGGFTESEVSKIVGRMMKAMGVLNGDFTYFTVVHHYIVSIPIHISTTFPCPILCAIARPSRDVMVAFIYEKHPEFSAVVNQTSWFVINAHRGEGNPMASAYGYCTVSVGIMYIVVGAITVHLILRDMNMMKAHMSVRTYKLHRNLLVALCWQAAVPVVTYIIPLLTAALIICLGLESNFPQGWMDMFWALIGTHSMLNVILMTYFTKPYREFAIEILNRFGLFKKKTKIDVAHVSQSQSSTF